MRESMICQNKKCGKEIPDDYIFCGYCGRKVKSKKASERKPRTRANGMGCAYKRGKTYTAEVSVADEIWEEKADPATGEIKRVKVIKHIPLKKGGFPTKTIALQYIPELKKLHDEEKKKPKGVENGVAKTELTFIEVYEAWDQTQTKRVENGTLSIHTLSEYRTAKNNFSDVHYMTFNDIGIDEIQECVDEKKGKGSKATMRTLMHLLYEYAIPRHIVTISLDISKYIDVSGKKGTHPALPEDVVELIGRYAWSMDYAAMVYVLCYTGYRPTELFTRRPSDYDHDQQLIHGGIKTQAGIEKIVTLSPKIIPIVEFYASKGHEFIFCRNDGSPLKSDYFIDRFFEVLDKLGIQKIPKPGEKPTYVPYSCRHSFSNKLKNAPGSDVDKAALFGHSQYKTTQKFYQQGEIKNLREITDSL
jgi:integrase